MELLLDGDIDDNLSLESIKNKISSESKNKIQRIIAVSRSLDSIKITGIKVKAIHIEEK